jgi:hypothetical protein
MTTCASRCVHPLPARVDGELLPEPADDAVILRTHHMKAVSLVVRRIAVPSSELPVHTRLESSPWAITQIALESGWCLSMVPTNLLPVLGFLASKASLHKEGGDGQFRLLT